jgi:hypothetical protein
MTLELTNMLKVVSDAQQLINITLSVVQYCACHAPPDACLPALSRVTSIHATAALTSLCATAVVASRLQCSYAPSARDAGVPLAPATTNQQPQQQQGSNGHLRLKPLRKVVSSVQQLNNRVLQYRNIIC